MSDDSIAQFLMAAIPGLTEGKLEEIKQALMTQGFTEMDHLSYLEPEADLKTVLNTLQLRVLKARLKEKAPRASETVIGGPFPSETTPGTSVAMPTNTSNSVPTNRGTSTPGSFVDLSWAEDFNIPWDMCGETLKQACSNKTIPNKRELLAFNRLVGDQIYKINKRPGKKALSIIARKICAKYPDTFQDHIPGFGTLGDGTRSVLGRLVNYIDGKNRTGTNSLRRKLYEIEKSEEETDEENGKKRRASSTFLKDSYGCVHWQPDCLPDGETENTQEAKREWLLSEFKRDREHQDSSKTRQYWKETYSSQRYQINRKESQISQVIKEWPHFTEPSLLLAHFDTLMGFRLLERLDDQLSKKSGDILSYAFEMGNKKARAAAAQLRTLAETLKSDLPKLPGVFWLLPHLFDEDQEILFKPDEDTATGRELEQTDKVAHPHIIIAGEHPFLDNCYVMVESCIMAARVPFRKAVGVMFASYYVLNIAYPVEAAATLEFLQRMFAGINPDRGSKTEKVKKKRTNSAHPKVVRLLGNLQEYHNKWNY